MKTKRFSRFPGLIAFATAYADQNDKDETFEIPAADELAEMSTEDLQALESRGREVFDGLYGDGKGLTAEEYGVLQELTTGLTNITDVLSGRSDEEAKREADAAELAAKVRSTTKTETEVEEDADADGDADDSDDSDSDDEDGDDDADENDDDADGEEDGDEDESLTASATKKRTSVSLSAVRGRQSRAVMNQAAAKDEDKAPEGIKQVLVASGDGLGYGIGEAIDYEDAAKMLDKRLTGFNERHYRQMASQGRHVREQHSLLQVNRPIPDDLMLDDGRDAARIDEVIARATEQSNIQAPEFDKEGALVAAGGWCAPSEIDYSLGDEFETRDGLYSIPEVGINRGGLSFTTGIDFREIYRDLVSFSFTEEQDINGEYAPGENPGDPNVVGSKPCFRIDCPEFDEYRLDVDGLCIKNGILQSRGYPEVGARVIRGALVAHAHRIDAKVLAQVEAGSTQIAMPSTQAGAAAPILSAIELQAIHYRAVRRMSDNRVLEAVFPKWTFGLIRQDLARRLGVDMISVPDSRIRQWFANLNIAPQFVTNWQDIAAQEATAFTAFPSTIKFHLYAAGTWFKGISPLITMESIYDSVLLGQNDYTALFTEEAWFVAKRGQDSRTVSVQLSADGSTHAGVDIAHNGTLVTAG